MHNLNIFKALALTSCALIGVAQAAPLPDDVPDGHWAKDAVASLAERGLLQGYTDATFKGDRAMTRWEMASVVARLMAQLEAQQSNFASKAELDALERLANNLRPELEALGVRVSALEAQTDVLDKRVSELERITFYGSLQTVFGAQKFYNRTPKEYHHGLLDYDQIIGSATGAGGLVTTGPAAGLTMNPFIFGNMTVTDWTSGRALTSGSACSSTLRLGTNFTLNDNFQGGAEFAAYASVGDSVVDAYWGAAQPYSCNPFTAISANNSGTGANNHPYTRMCLDHFWLEHKPSHTRITVGAFNTENFDPFIYVSELNPNAFGDKYLGSYGVKVNGSVEFDEREKGNRLLWEAMGSRLADGNVNNTVPNNGYLTHCEGGNLTFLFDEERGRLRGNFLHTANEGSDGALAQSGLYLASNLNLGWVNTPNNYIGQFASPAAVAGMGSVTDQRPIGMIGAVVNDGITGIPGVPNLGGIGPQEMFSYGFSGRYKFDVTCQPELFAEYGRTQYTSNRRSEYKVTGDLWRVGVNTAIGKNKYGHDLVNFDVSYKSIDPTYDPFILPFPQSGGIGTVLWRPNGFNYINSMYSLQDTDTYIHNRRGIDAEIRWRFLPTGTFTLGYGNYEQVKTSQQDVRYSANSLGFGIPNTNVLGFSPGFIDSVFSGFSPYTYAPDGSGNAFGTALENPRGTVEKWYTSVGLKYLFEPGISKRGVTFGGGYRDTHFLRKSHLSELVAGDNGLRGENQNNVDLRVGGWKVFVNYEPTESLKLDFSVNKAYIKGHLDPLGILGDSAVATGDTNAKIVALNQLYPQIKVDYDINSAWNVGLMGRYYWTTDSLPREHSVTPTLGSMNLNFGQQDMCHVASWDGWQVMTYCNFKF